MQEIQADVVIVGAGPAGLAAALYCARGRYETFVLDKFVPGGQINLTDRIENYPAIKRISGLDMVAVQVDQCNEFGAKIKNNAEVTQIEKLPEGMLKVVTDEETYITRVVILTPGSDYRRLGVPGEEAFRNAGAGVSYCGTCDAAFFRDREVVAIGGGNVAVEDTIHLSRYCSKVTMVHRRDEFRAEKILVEELLDVVKTGKIDIKYDTVCTVVNGKDKVESAKLQNVKTGESWDQSCDGVFVFVGMIPNTSFLKGVVDLDEYGFVKCDTTYFRTNVPGIFVAGDCRINAAMQLATAVGDAVAAAVFMKEYLRDPNWWTRV